LSSESAPSVNAIPSIVIYDPSLGLPRYATGSVLTNSTPQDVKIVDANGSQVTFDSLIGPGEPVIDSYTHLAVNLNAGADQVLVSSAANKQIWVYGVHLVLSVAGTLSFQDEDNLAITGIIPYAANSGPAMPPSGNFAMPIWKLATDKDLEIDIVTASVDGWLDYSVVSV